MSLLLDLVERQGVTLRRVSPNKGGEYQGPCPFPDCPDGPGENRFHLWPEQNQGEGSFWCRQCKRAGDAIAFLMEREGLSFPEAAARVGRPLSEAPAAPLPKQRQRPKPEPVSYGLPPETWREKAGAFIQQCYDSLFKASAVLKWLASRGIREETAARFGLGLNPGKGGKDLFKDREAWGLPVEFNENGRRRALWLPRGLVIPGYAGADLCRVRIRRNNAEGGPKYYVVPGSVGATWFSAPEPGAGPVVYVVVESELDGVLLAQEAGGLAGVAALGSSSAKPDENAFKALAGADYLLIALDYDRAGAAALAWWAGNFKKTKHWPVPTGKDPGEAWASGADLKAWIRAGFPDGLRRLLKEEG